MNLKVVLYEPEIPPNTGNVIRLCANTGASLHLIEPLGFSWDDRRLKRAGLDYHEWADVALYPTLAAFYQANPTGARYAFTTRGSRRFTDAQIEPDATLLFGPETRGLPDSVLATFAADRRLRVPMQPHSRSLNMANAVAVVLYEAWRQQDFAGAV